MCIDACEGGHSMPGSWIAPRRLIVVLFSCACLRMPRARAHLRLHAGALARARVRACVRAFVRAFVRACVRACPRVQSSRGLEPRCRAIESVRC